MRHYKRSFDHICNSNGVMFDSDKYTPEQALEVAKASVPIVNLCYARYTINVGTGQSGYKRCKESETGAFPCWLIRR